jgi:hypothetical protein
LRKELIELEGLNPMVRMVNLETGRYATNDRPETYRRFTTYMNAWISRMPEGLQAEMEKRYGAEARAWLKSAEASQDAASLRDLVDTHFFTEAGMKALNLLIALDIEQGDFLDVASWLLRLREMRPSVWKDSPGHMLRLLLALSALGDEELLEPMIREASAIANSRPSSKVARSAPKTPRRARGGTGTAAVAVPAQWTEEGVVCRISTGRAALARVEPTAARCCTKTRADSAAASSRVWIESTSANAGGGTCGMGGGAGGAVLLKAGCTGASATGIGGGLGTGRMFGGGVRGLLSTSQTPRATSTAPRVRSLAVERS